MNIRDYYSSLDTLRFGFKIAKVNKFNDDPEYILELLKENGFKLLICRINCEEINLINKLEFLGFLIKDIQVSYKYNLNNNNYMNHHRNHHNNNILIRDANKNDVNKLQIIAYESFNNYGHYFADNNLNKDKCSEIYKDWVKRSFSGKKYADKIIVAEIEKEIVGFLTFKIINHNHAASGLGAVANKYRNKDVFSSITIEGLKWGKKIGLKWVEHNVLITNYAINRTFSKLGFKIYKSFLTFHYWFD